MSNFGMSEPAKKEVVDSVKALSVACDAMERVRHRLDVAQAELESAERSIAQARERRDAIGAELAAARAKVKSAARAVASEG
jgi:septal ring factor EnvC (AmiA/AmiB activator)